MLIPLQLCFRNSECELQESHLLQEEGASCLSLSGGLLSSSAVLQLSGSS